MAGEVAVNALRVFGVYQSHGRFGGGLTHSDVTLF
jgi:hypothetical protein